jgi:TrmH family RNA methyltransferase
MFVVEGPKLVDELLKSDFSTEAIFALESWIDEKKNIINEVVDLVKIKAKELDRISGLKTPNQVLAIAKLPSNPGIHKSIFSELVIMLDEIKDPGNLGTIIRTADWFGIQHLICSKDSVDAFNPKVVQASMGSVFRMKIYYEDLKSLLSDIDSTTQVYGALLNGENIYKIQKANSGIILIGNESKGIAEELFPYITKRVSIPSYAATANGGPESLNASIATALFCAEFRRISK